MILNFLKEATSTIIIPLVFCIGLYLSFKLRWLQIKYFCLGIKHIFRKNQVNANFSSFAALAAVLGGNLGTGNIAGIAVALSTGGPGALFWMWVMALLGAIIKFTGCYLGVQYQQRHKKYGWVGGPMFYLIKGLGFKTAANLFCLFTIFSALTVGNLVQINSIALPLNETGISPLLTGSIMALFVAIVLVGEVKMFSLVASRIVPFMAIIYLSACIIILYLYSDKIAASLWLIIQSAFDSTSVLGGTLGFTVFNAIKVGFNRGLFATDAGVGLAPILHAQVGSSDNLQQENAFMQGMVSIVAPIVVMFICMITTLVLLVTDTWNIPLLESTNTCIRAFQSGLGHKWAGNLVMLTLVLFAFTTILTWAHCAEKAIAFLINDKAIYVFRLLFVAIIPIGACCKVWFVWSIADLSLNCMLLINLIGVVGLSKQVIRNVQNRLKKEKVLVLDANSIP